MKAKKQKKKEKTLEERLKIGFRRMMAKKSTPSCTFLAGPKKPQKQSKETSESDE